MDQRPAFRPLLPLEEFDMVLLLSVSIDKNDAYKRRRDMGSKVDPLHRNTLLPIYC